MQIIVLGMHRSGTSLVTRLINIMGAYVGPEESVLPVSSDNPKGFWERLDVILINDALLARHGCDWAHLSGLPATLPAAEGKLHSRIQAIVTEMDARRPWVMKDPRHCLTLPCWLPMLEMPVCVIVHRDPQEVVRSLTKRNEITTDHALALWEYHTVFLLNASQHLPRIFVSHREALTEPVEFTGKLHEALAALHMRGLTLPHASEIIDFIDPKLYRAKPVGNLRLSPAQQQLCAIMQGKQPQGGELSISDESVNAMKNVRKR